MRRVSINERIVKEKKKKKSKKILLILLVFVFLISVFSVSIVQAIRVFGPFVLKTIDGINNKFFKIKEVAIIGAGEYGEREIREYIEPIVKVNPNLLTIPVSSIKIFLATRPYLSSAEIRKELPGRLVVSVKEKKTVAILIKNGFYLVDENGIIIRQMQKGENIDVPVITVEENVDESVFEEYLKTICLLINLDNKSTPSMSFSELRITKNGIIARSMDLKSDEKYIPPVYFSKENAEKKLLQLKKLWPEIVKKKNQIEYIDSRFKQGIVVKSKTTEEHYNG